MIRWIFGSSEGDCWLIVVNKSVSPCLENILRITSIPRSAWVAGMFFVLRKPLI